MLPSANVFLLTHKCGNTYYQSLFKNDDTHLICGCDDFQGEFPGPYVGRFSSSGIDKSFVNIRCRNFSTASTEKLLRHINVSTSRFFIFVRHPASFFRSAASYHLRGKEKWTHKSKYSCLGGKTLNEAIVAAENEEERLIVCMKLFGITWNLLDRWRQNYRLLVSMGANFRVIKTEDLFQDGTESFFSSLAEFMSHGGYRMTENRLKKSSPLYMEKLPSHSTGEFRKDPFTGFSQNALAMYYNNFYSLQNFFYHDNPTPLL